LEKAGWFAVFITPALSRRG